MEKDVLRKLFKETKEFIEAYNGVIDINVLHNELDFEKSGIETGLSIFEELGFIERKEEKVNLLNHKDKKDLEDSKIYAEGKGLKEKLNRDSYQLGMDSVENLWQKILDIIDVEKKDINHERELNTIKTNNGSQHETEVVETDSAETEHVASPKRSGAKVNVEQVRVIHERVADGETLHNLSREYGMSLAGMWIIVKRNTWKDIE